MLAERLGSEHIHRCGVLQVCNCACARLEYPKVVLAARFQLLQETLLAAKMWLSCGSRRCKSSSIVLNGARLLFNRSLLPKGAALRVNAAAHVIVAVGDAMHSLVVDILLGSAWWLRFFPGPDTVSPGLNRGQSRCLVDRTLWFTTAARHDSIIVRSDTLSSSPVCERSHKLN